MFYFLTMRFDCLSAKYVLSSATEQGAASDCLQSCVPLVPRFTSGFRQPVSLVVTPVSHPTFRTPVRRFELRRGTQTGREYTVLPRGAVEAKQRWSWACPSQRRLPGGGRRLWRLTISLRDAKCAVAGVPVCPVRQRGYPHVVVGARRGISRNRPPVASVVRR